MTTTTTLKRTIRERTNTNGSTMSSTTATTTTTTSPLSSSSSSSEFTSPSSVLVRNSIVAGSCSGIVSTMILYPMDVIRTKMQASSSSSSIHQNPSNYHMRGPWYVFRHTVQQGGISALYTGLALPLAAQVVYKSTIFVVNNITLQYIQLNHKQTTTTINHNNNSESPYEKKKESMKLNAWDRFVCGFVGGAVNAVLFVTPVELVRNQLIAQQQMQLKPQQQQHKPFQGSFDVIRYAMTRPEGIRTLWRGASWTLWRDGLGCGIFFVAMQATQDYCTPPNESPSFVIRLVSGGMAGLAFWMVGLPLDTIKTWSQSSTDWTIRFSAQRTLQTIYQEGGLQAICQRLFHGWQVAYGRGIPSAAITMSVYSGVFAELQRYSQQ